jgi:hypothetical protein
MKAMHNKSEWLTAFVCLLFIGPWITDKVIGSCATGSFSRRSVLPANLAGDPYGTIM